jgi:hypothetical protein
MSATPLSGWMRATATAMDRDAGRLDRKGNYRKACDTLRLADLLREVAWQVEGWEAGQELKAPLPGSEDPAGAGIDDK